MDIQEGANMWELIKLPTGTPISDWLEIINDAMCYGFEFKVENHDIYFREVTN